MGTQEETGVLDRFAGMPSRGPGNGGGGGGNGHTALLMSDFAAADEEPVRRVMMSKPANGQDLYTQSCNLFEAETTSSALWVNSGCLGSWRLVRLWDTRLSPMFEICIKV